MGIRAKTLSLVAVLIIVTWAVLLGAAAMFAESVANDSERADVKYALARADQGFVNDAEPLNIFVGDWANWDDTYDFVNGANPDYQRAVLTTGVLDAYDVDFIVVTDLGGSIVGSVCAEPGTRAVRPVPAGLVDYIATNPPILNQRTYGDQKSGVLGLPEGVAIVSASPVTDTNAAAPIAGTIMAGRFLDKVRTAKINDFTLVPAEAYSVAATSLPAEVVSARDRLNQGEPLVVTPISDHDVVGYSFFSDVDGKPAVIVQATQPRESILAARAAMRWFSGAMFALLMLLLIIIGVSMDRMVLRRLTAFRHELDRVRESGDPSARVVVAGADEIASVARDVNDMLSEIEASQSDLAFLAVHDPLTMLFNRRRFESELQGRLREDRAFGALLWFDLDHFKEINDSLGHAAGDELLVELARMLSEETRGSSTLARLGGDEFGVLLPETDRDEALAAADRLLDLLGHHEFHVAGHEVRLSASVGIVLYPEHGRSADDLLARADLAMYQAKDGGRNAAILYTNDDEWRTEMTERIGLAAEIVAAIRENRLTLYAQPSVRISDNTPGPVELLLRMRDRDGHIILPDQVLPTCERIGLIRDVDRWVVRHAIALLANEQREGRQTRVSVNVSAMAFSDPEMLGIVRDELAAASVEPSCLALEITETSAISDLAHAQFFIRELKSLGCRFALDDFGAGVSSFSYLRHLPVDDLKIDGSLVRNLSDVPVDAHFLGAIVEMCRGLQITTIAEHIESQELYDLVAERGVDYAQGFYVGLPLPAEEYFRTLRR